MMSQDSNHGAVTLFSERPIVLTREMAAAFLGVRTDLPFLRKVSSRRVQQLASAIELGDFIWPITRIVTALIGDKEHLLNGRHVCRARLELDDQAHYDGTVTYQVFQAADENAVQCLYGAIDPDPREVKQEASLIETHLASDPVFAALENHLQRRLVKSYSFFRWQDPSERSKHGVREVIHLLQTEDLDLGQGVALMLQEFSNNFFVQPLLIVPVVSAMFATTRSNSAKSVEFWKALLLDDDVRAGRTPQNELTRLIVSYSSKRSRRVRRFDSEEVYRVCIASWNRWQG